LQWPGGLWRRLQLATRSIAGSNPGHGQHRFPGSSRCLESEAASLRHTKKKKN